MQHVRAAHDEPRAGAAQQRMWKRPAQEVRHSQAPRRRHRGRRVRQEGQAGRQGGSQQGGEEERCKCPRPSCAPCRPLPIHGGRRAGRERARILPSLDQFSRLCRHPSLRHEHTSTRAALHVCLHVHVCVCVFACVVPRELGARRSNALRSPCAFPHPGAQAQGGQVARPVKRFPRGHEERARGDSGPRDGRPHARRRALRARPFPRAVPALRTPLQRHGSRASHPQVHLD